MGAGGHQRDGVWGLWEVGLVLEGVGLLLLAVLEVVEGNVQVFVVDRRGRLLIGFIPALLRHSHFRESLTVLLLDLRCVRRLLLDLLLFWGSLDSLQIVPLVRRILPPVLFLIF